MRGVAWPTSADVELHRDDDVPFPNIGTDLFVDDFGNFDDDEEPLDSGPVIPDILKEEVAQTVVHIENEDEESDDGDADADLENGRATESPVPEAPMDAPAPVSAKKAGRASKGPSRVATPAKTPKSAKAAAGRKRKAVEEADEPAAKRPGRGRATAAAAREGIKEASKKRPRAAPGTVKEVRLHLRFSAGRSVLREMFVTDSLWRGSRHQNPVAVDLAESPRSRRMSPPERSTRSRRSWTTEWTPIQSRPCSWSSGRATTRRTTPGSQRRT